MPSVSSTTHLDHLVRETQRAREVLGSCDPDASVPACPDWNASDLAWHLGVGVQDFWRYVIETRPAPPTDYVEPTQPDDPAEVLAAFDRCHEPFIDALRAADPDEPAWSWSEQTVGFTMRRQALEAMVHRVDAEQAAGLEVTALDPQLAADGVDEVLDVFYGGAPDWGHFAPDDEIVQVRMTDVDADCWVHLGRFSGTHPERGETYEDEDDLRVVAEPDGEVDVVISGTAPDIVLWLWDRRDDAGIEFEGDKAVGDRFRSIVGQPLN